MVKKAGKYMWVLVWLGYFGLSTHGYGYVVSSQTLPRQATYMQVGAFSQASSLRNIAHKLRHFPLWMEREGEMVRVFVILPQSDIKKKNTVRKIKTIIPDAFIRYGFRPDKNITTKGVLFESVDDEPLDSKAILNTRKKFF